MDVFSESGILVNQTCSFIYKHIFINLCERLSQIMWKKTSEVNEQVDRLWNKEWGCLKKSNILCIRELKRGGTVA